MRNHSTLDVRDRYQISGAARPPAAIDLVQSLLVPTLALAATGAAIALIQRIGTWLSP